MQQAIDSFSNGRRELCSVELVRENKKRNTLSQLKLSSTSLIMNNLQNHNTCYSLTYMTFGAKGLPGLHSHYVEKL